MFDDLMKSFGGGNITNAAIAKQGQATNYGAAPTSQFGQFGAIPGIGVPGAIGGGSMFDGLFSGGTGAGSNLQLGLGALQTLGGLWNSYNTGKLAKESLSFQKDAFERNAANQEQSYNTALEDRIRARYNTEGRSAKEADGYIEKHSL